MPEISPEALREVTQALERYRQVVSESELRPNSNALGIGKPTPSSGGSKANSLPARESETNGYLTRSATLDIDDSL